MPQLVDLLPYKKFTLVSSYSVAEVMEKLGEVTHDAREGRSSDPYLLFNGQIEEGAFRISRKINAANNFLPLIHGRMEETSSGCIIFLTYSLFYSTQVILVTWTLLTMLFAIFFLVQRVHLAYALLAFVLLVLNYMITTLNFQKQIKLSKRLLERVLS